MTFSAIADLDRREWADLRGAVYAVAFAYADGADNDGAGGPFPVGRLTLDDLARCARIDREDAAAAVAELLARGYLRPDEDTEGRAVTISWPSTEPRRRAIPARVMLAVFRRDNFRCVRCKTVKPDLTIDHIQPVSLGGGDELANLQTMCKSCNSRKGARVS
jgi:hypothetical protein